MFKARSKYAKAARSAHSNNNKTNPEITVQKANTEKSNTSRTYAMSKAAFAKQANAVVREMILKNKSTLTAMMPGPTEQTLTERPLDSAGWVWQDASDIPGQEVQVDVHFQTAGLLAAFSFAALVADGPSMPERHPNMAGFIDIFEAKNEGPGLEYYKTIASIIDQVRTVGMLITMCTFIVSFMGFLYVSLMMTGSASRRSFRAWNGAINRNCIRFHLGLFLLLALMPFYIFKFFGFSIVFLIAIAIPLRTIMKIGNLNQVYAEFSNLLRNIEVGILEPADSTNDPSHGQYIDRRTLEVRYSQLDGLRFDDSELGDSGTSKNGDFNKYSNTGIAHNNYQIDANSRTSTKDTTGVISNKNFQHDLELGCDSIGNNIGTWWVENNERLVG